MSSHSCTTVYLAADEGEPTGLEQFERTIGDPMLDVFIKLTKLLFTKHLCPRAWGFGDTSTQVGVKMLQCHNMQECDATQSMLLSLHNLFNHPALRSCLTTQHQAAYAAAVKCWAPAVLKVRSSGNSGGMMRRSSCGDASTQECSSGSCPVLGYRLLQHTRALAVAAQSSQSLICQVSPVMF